MDTVESVAAVVSRLAASTDYGELVAEGFSEAMMSDAAVNHLSSISVVGVDGLEPPTSRSYSGFLVISRSIYEEAA